MPASCSERRSPSGPATRAARGALVAAALAATACTTRDIPATPFRLEAVVVSTGRSLADGITTPATIVRVGGTGTRIDDTTFEIDDATVGRVRLRFDRTVAPELAFPARLTGEQVLVDVFVDPGQLTPSGDAPMPISGFRIATQPAAPTYEFMLGESSTPLPSGAPGVPFSLEPVIGNEDIPFMELVVDFRDYEPARCGPVYLASLSIQLADRTVALQRGEQADMVVGSRPDPLHVLHVLSYQRRGRCSGQSESWTQIAAWR
ncbi:hypothetical protein [Anaeromyxobacter oryzae]|uniref:Lipoprotein n=1 Tax=Anaeromyxobacter oryzae TaxID=2918170 RepID=A0ABM7WV84_9BACT|nr:hypothetical protein [Anaeromyxobacter oryzae]BDG03366.1 hypothetical protein AMOR_23620 [Anaeromyxobacter oryzae]